MERKRGGQVYEEKKVTFNLPCSHPDISGIRDSDAGSAGNVLAAEAFEIYIREAVQEGLM